VGQTVSLPLPQADSLRYILGKWQMANGEWREWRVTILLYCKVGKLAILAAQL